MDTMTKKTNFQFRFAPAQANQRTLLHRWFEQEHIREWMHGVGLQNTLKGLEKFFQGESKTIYWVGYDKEIPFAFLITSPEGDDAITLDLFICDLNYLGKGFSVPMIRDFLMGQFPHMKRVLIDPEASNTRAIHVYQKVGFKIIGEFIASWHPVPHYQMELYMKDLLYHLEHHDSIPTEYEKILFREISQDAFRAKGLPPIQSLSVFIKDEKQKIVGGVTGVTFYGSLYVDMLWMDKALRHQGWGTRLMQEAEKIGKERGSSFATVNTMDWEALPFYQKLGYSIEFTREGYEKGSKMFMLRKNL